LDRYPDLATHALKDPSWAIKHYIKHGYFEGRIWRKQGELITDHTQVLDQFDYLYRHAHYDQLLPFLEQNIHDLSQSLRVFIVGCNRLDSAALLECYNALRTVPKFKKFKEKYPGYLIKFFAKQIHEDFFTLLEDSIANGIASNWTMSLVQKAFKIHMKAFPNRRDQLIELSAKISREERLKAPPLEMISLGLNCEVAKNINLWRDTELNDAEVNQFIEPAINGGQFFDWNISSLSAVLKCISKDFDDVLLKTNIRVREEKTGTFNYIDDIGTGIRFHHLFSRINDITTEAIVEQEYDQKKSKVDYLVRKFLDSYLLTQPVFYLRRGDDSFAELKLLCDAIRKRRHGRPFFVVSIRADSLREDAENLLVHHMPYTGVWSGDPNAWRDLFLKLRAISVFSEQRPKVVVAV